MNLGALRILRYREYRLLCYGQTASSMGGWMDEVTRGWLVYELTDSVMQLGLVRGIQAIPFLLLSPVAGSYVDRHSRKKILIITQSLQALIMALTALLVFSGEIRIWHVYVVAAVVAVMQVFQQPARSAMISNSVPREFLTNAIGFNSLVFNVARTLGPALAGGLIVFAGTAGTFAVQAIFIFTALAWTIAMRADDRSVTGADARSRARESFTQSIVEGWKFSWKNEAVRASLFCAMLVSFFVVPFTALMPVFARDLLEVGADGQGLLLTGMGIGAFCSAAFIALAGDRLPRGLFMFGSVIIYGLIVMGFAASPWFALSFGLMLLAGLSHPLSNALVQTVIQSHAPVELHGRTMALFSMHQVLITAGSVLLGALAVALGPRWAMAAMGAVGALSIVLVMVVMPKARLIR
ncbi:MAG: MFS transporter [Betaproteobacteria bacterium]|nr:MFS transporter [Betaproteobacteria bacterium]